MEIMISFDISLILKKVGGSIMKNSNGNEMFTKLDHFTKVPEEKNIHSIIRIYYSFNQLKNLFRQGWLLRGVEKEFGESVAEHTLGVAILAMFIADQYSEFAFDRDKLVTMALIHDFGEIYAGDLVPGIISREQKYQIERNAMVKVLSPLPEKDKYLSCWEEFEAGETPEAKLLKQLDRLEMALQASIYEHAFDLDLTEFMNSADRVIQDELLQEIFNEIQMIRPAKLS
jgi:putative hydrolase of HD superfamily